MENSMAVTQKIKYWITIWSSNTTAGYISKRIESRVSERYSYIHVHISIIHYSQEVEATQIFIDGWMDKQNVECYATLERKEIL